MTEETFLKIVIAIVGLVGAFIALRGDTWDDSQRSWWHKLTWTGRWAALFLLAGFAVTLRLNHIQQVAVDFAKQEEEKAKAELDAIGDTTRANQEFLDRAGKERLLVLKTDAFLKAFGSFVQQQFSQAIENNEEADVRLRECNVLVAMNDMLANGVPIDRRVAIFTISSILDGYKTVHKSTAGTSSDVLRERARAGIRGILASFETHVLLKLSKTLNTKDLVDVRIENLFCTLCSRPAAYRVTCTIGGGDQREWKYESDVRADGLSDFLPVYKWSISLNLSGASHYYCDKHKTFYQQNFENRSNTIKLPDIAKEIKEQLRAD